MIRQYQEFTIDSVTQTADGKLEVVKRYPSNSMFACNPPRPVPPTITKEVYAAVNGRIELVDTIQGKVTPSYVTPETVSF